VCGIGSGGGGVGGFAGGGHLFFKKNLAGP